MVILKIKKNNYRKIIFCFHIFIICKLSMKLQLQYIGELDTNDEIKELFSEQSAENLHKLYDHVSPVLYEFRVTYNHGESIIYRSHDEIIRFLRKCMSKSKQFKEKYKTASFDLIKKHDVINLISATNDIEKQQWFQQFFSIGLDIHGRTFSLTLQKQSGGRYSQFKCCFCLNWKKCKVYILNDGVITYDQSKNKIQQFMHFGKDFSWEVYKNLDEDELYIHSYHRKMTLRAYRTQQFFTFIYTLDKFLKEYKRNQIEYRFNSFAPMRHSNKVEFFVDGADYFEALAYGIESAEEEVFICGWWISPQFNLIRPCEGKNKDYRFDNLLARTAAKGVKIYVVVYYESSFLTNDSTYTIQALVGLHQNIRVLRHPQIVLPTYWSHHEKLVVIDQCLAFLGGLDICYGRYDDSSHSIKQTPQKQKFYPGIQYNNCRIADFVQVRDFTRENVGRHLPRLPWHDVALMVKGDCVKDLSRHFIQYWNYASFQTHYADRYVLISNSTKVVPKKKAGFMDTLKEFAEEVKAKVNIHKLHKEKEQKFDSNQLKQSNMDNMSEQVQSQRIVPTLPAKKSLSFKDTIMQKIMPNKRSQILNASPRELNSKKESPSAELMYVNSDKRSTQNNDDGINIEEIEFSMKKQLDERKRKMSAEEVLEEELQKQEMHKIQKKQEELKDTFTQISMFATKIQQKQRIEEGAQGDYLHQKQNKIQPPPKRNSLQIFTNFTSKLFSGKKPVENMRQVHKQAKVEAQEVEGESYTCQALRSVSQWSIGSKDYEKSISDAYVSLIKKSQKFIYIQNQFFISATHKYGVVKNKIMEAIADRIIRAIKNDQNFKVMVMMPLVPGFAGELDDPSASLPRVIMNWQYKTICRGENSLLGRIMKETDTPQLGNYIQFYGLRNHAVINDKPYTEIIYLHSKLMIVDDRYLICGSANINDRSMEGNRDSQLCLLVEGEPKAEIIINKKPFAVVEKIHKLRTKLWWEHFGISEFQARNPNDDALWQRIYNTALNNTLVYRTVFGCYPDDEIKNLQEIGRFRKKVELKQYEENQHKIKGHSVLFPLKFLENEKLTSYHPHAISI